MIQLLVAHVTARLAILGPGGMGKTTVALALLYEPRVMLEYGIRRFFISCEALVDADGIVVSLAKLLELPISKDLLTAVVAFLNRGPRAAIVLDNLETVWLAGGAPVAAVDELLGQLAQIPTLSLIITCRSTDLPQLVKWSNPDDAVLEPFSLEAALQTFQDRSGYQIKADDESVARQLLDAVDMMPLAVSLLGQLSRRGNSVSELLARWNRKRTALLRTHGTGRFNNAGVSIELSINMSGAADDSQESLRLLSVCSMLPDGLHRSVFEKLRSLFEDIDYARDNLCAYSLASLSGDGILRMLSPVRHHVLERHPPQPEHRGSLCSIYFDIAGKLPVDVNEQFKKLAAAAAPEMKNLSSLLLTLADQPSQQIVDAIVRFTRFAYFQQPTLVVASALLPHLEPHPKWKAQCLKVIGNVQIKLCSYLSAIECLATAAELFDQIGDRSEAAWCLRTTGSPHRHLGEYDKAEALFQKAQKIYTEMGDELEQARCGRDLGDLMRTKGDYSAAIEYSSAARHKFISLGRVFEASWCSESLSLIYAEQGNLDSAATELEAARSAFISLGNQNHMAQSARLLGGIRRKQGKLELAERLLGEAEAIYTNSCNRFGLASCAMSFGYLRIDQGRTRQAITHFRSAHHLYTELQVRLYAEDCRKQVEKLEVRVLLSGNDSE